MRASIHLRRHFSQPPAIVFSSMITGLGVIRSLGKAGVPVVALDPNPLAPGLHSRYATKGLVCPDPLKSEKAFVDFLVGLGQELGQEGVLLPTSDTYVPVLARSRLTLKPLFHLPPYDEQNLRRLTDKRIQGEVVEQAGVPVPRSFYPGSLAEVRALSVNLRYPIVLKPTDSRSFFMRYGTKAYLVGAAQELVRRYQEFLDSGHSMFIQEFIEGGPQNLQGVITCTDSSAHPMFAFITKKVILEPPVFGNVVITQQVYQSQVAELGSRVIHALGFKEYLCNPQFKYDGTEGRWKFLELNPRPPSTIALATFCGVNLPFMAYQQLLGKPVSARAIQVEGASWVLELTSPNGYRNLMVTLLAHRHRHLRQATFAFFSVDDPKPFFYAMMLGLQEAKNKLAFGRMSS